MSVDDYPRSDGTGIATGFGSRFSRYDLLLALLPTPLTAGLLWASVNDLPAASGAAVGGLLAALLLAYGLFVDAPVPASRDRGSRGV